MKDSLDSLGLAQKWLASVPIHLIVDLLDDFSTALVTDDRTKRIEGITFLAAWLKKNNLHRILCRNLNDTPAYLDGFVESKGLYLAAKPQGVVAMWMPGNIPLLSIFSMVSALLTKNACLLKLASEDSGQTMDCILSVLSECAVKGLKGEELLTTITVLHFNSRLIRLNKMMSQAADAKIIWGSTESIAAVSELPKQDHCSEIIFGPKYSIGVMDACTFQQDIKHINHIVKAFARDIAFFNQAACSSPQTIFVEKNHKYPLQAIGQLFAAALDRLPEKKWSSAFQTVQILNTRADWAMTTDRDIICSKGRINWTVCMDREASLKEAVQGRTIFLSEVESWKAVLPLLSHKIQTVGIAFNNTENGLEFSEAATARGVVRCIRPGLMNLFDFPWDGKLLLGQLVRWVSAKL